MWRQNAASASEQKVQHHMRLPCHTWPYWSDRWLDRICVTYRIGPHRTSSDLIGRGLEPGRGSGQWAGGMVPPSVPVLPVVFNSIQFQHMPTIKGPKVVFPWFSMWFHVFPIPGVETCNFYSSLREFVSSPDSGFCQQDPNPNSARSSQGSETVSRLLVLRVTSNDQHKLRSWRLWRFILPCWNLWAFYQMKPRKESDSCRGRGSCSRKSKLAYLHGHDHQQTWDGFHVGHSRLPSRSSTWINRILPWFRRFARGGAVEPIAVELLKSTKMYSVDRFLDDWCANALSIILNRFWLLNIRFHFYFTYFFY